MTAALRRYPLFALLPRPILGAWAAAGREHAYATGELLFQEGTAGEWVYLLLAGRVRVLRTTPAGREVTVATLAPGQVFGEYALVPPGQNTATCRAAAAVRVLRLPLGPLRQAVAALPGVGSRLKDWLRLHALLHHLRERVAFGFQSAPSALKYLDALQTVRVAPLRTVQADGLAGDRWFVIESGAVRLHHADGTADDLGPGDCFGEAALLGRPGLSTAVAVEESGLQALSRDAFLGRPTGDGHSLQTFQPVAPPAWVGQREEADCGLAALAMIARHHGRSVTLDELRGRVQLDERGLSLMRLQALAGEIGLHAEAVRIGPEQWPQVALPAVAHLASGHYVVVYQYDVTQCQIGDPASGLERVSRPLFLQQASGRLLVFRPEPG
ncbi:MAG: cyclic nucleotide-binding domain-containing protein [Gemmataceae bacterium]